MDGIERTEGLPPLDPGKRPDRIERADREGPSVEPRKGEKPPGDSASISADAAEVARYQELVQLHREAYGEADRSEHLARVRQRLEEGFYDRPEVMEELVDRVMEETSPAPVGSSDPEAIQRRTREGFYDRPEVVDRTAENVVRQVVGPRPRGG
jgi:hypothetical protein